jgi:hypothetical protein
MLNPCQAIITVGQEPDHPDAVVTCRHPLPATDLP